VGDREHGVTAAVNCGSGFVDCPYLNLRDPYLVNVSGNML
jgi:hypothetical protein